MYRQVDGQYYFVGDPTPFDYQGPRHGYYGPHPIVEADVHIGEPEYCYLQGPHYHSYEPPPQASFEMRGGVYWFTGTYDPVYYEQRPRYVVVNDAYAPIVYARPVVDITVAPAAFHGEIIAGGPGWHGQAVVAAPPPPVVQVGVGINVGGPPGEVYVEHDRGGHRGWEHERGGWHQAPPRGGGWQHGPAPVARGGGWHGNPQQSSWHGNPQQSSWHGNPQQPSWHGNPQQQQPSWHGGAPPQGHASAVGRGNGGGRPSHGGGWKR
jgi:hypothetical protein